MLERAHFQRYWVGATALLTGALLFWLALHCESGDWFISQTHADIIYVALRRFREFPYFSFIFNGGSYFLQDPQSNLFSPAVPLIWLTGPSLGLRLLEGLWGILGVYAFTGWMRRRVSTEAALVGAVASVTSLGVLWKIAAGNDMFLWHLGLPFLLWGVDRVLSERTLESALWFGLALGGLLLGPTFHSFTYLFLAVVPIFVLLEWAFRRPSRAQFIETVGLLALGCGLGLVIVSPKLVCWLTFPMGRPVSDPGALPLSTTLKYLFDYSVVDWIRVHTTRFVATAPRPAFFGWGVEECAVAMPPLGTALALLGLVAVVRTRAVRQLGVLALLLITIGVAITSSNLVWDHFRAFTGGNFRVAPRFLGMTAFGLSMFAAIGADALLSRLKRAVLPVTLGLLVLMLGSAVWWMRAASHFEDTVTTSGISPIQRYREERDAASRIDSFASVRSFRRQRDILSGVGYTDGFRVVGNAYKPKLWGEASSPLPIVVKGIEPSHVSIENLRIKLRDLPAHSKISLRLREPRYGLAVSTTPLEASVVVKQRGNLLEVANDGDTPVSRVTLRAELPISSLWFVLSGFGLLATCAALIWLGVARRRVAPLANVSAQLNEMKIGF